MAGAAGTKPQINDILLRQSHLKTQTPSVITSSRGPFSDVSQVSIPSHLANFLLTVDCCYRRQQPAVLYEPSGEPCWRAFRARTNRSDFELA